MTLLVHLQTEPHGARRWSLAAEADMQYQGHQQQAATDKIHSASIRSHGQGIHRVQNKWPSKADHSLQHGQGRKNLGMLLRPTRLGSHGAYRRHGHAAQTAHRTGGKEMPGARGHAIEGKLHHIGHNAQAAEPAIAQPLTTYHVQQRHQHQGGNPQRRQLD